MNRQLCLNTLNDYISMINRTADRWELQQHYRGKAEGFLLGIFYAEVITPEEFASFNSLIDTAGF